MKKVEINPRVGRRVCKDLAWAYRMAEGVEPGETILMDLSGLYPGLLVEAAVCIPVEAPPETDPPSDETDPSAETTPLDPAPPDPAVAPAASTTAESGEPAATPTPEVPAADDEAPPETDPPDPAATDPPPPPT